MVNNIKLKSLFLIILLTIVSLFFINKKIEYGMVQDIIIGEENYKLINKYNYIEFIKTSFLSLFNGTINDENIPSKLRLLKGEKLIYKSDGYGQRIFLVKDTLYIIYFDNDKIKIVEIFENNSKISGHYEFPSITKKDFILYLDKKIILVDDGIDTSVVIFSLEDKKFIQDNLYDNGRILSLYQIGDKYSVAGKYLDSKKEWIFFNKSIDPESGFFVDENIIINPAYKAFEVDLIFSNISLNIYRKIIYPDSVSITDQFPEYRLNYQIIFSYHNVELQTDEQEIKLDNVSFYKIIQNKLIFIRNGEIFHLNLLDSEIKDIKKIGNIQNSVHINNLKINTDQILLFGYRKKNLIWPEIQEYKTIKKLQ